MFNSFWFSVLWSHLYLKSLFGETWDGMSDIVTCAFCCSAYFSSGWVKNWRSFLPWATRDTVMGLRKKQRRMMSPKFVKYAATNPQATTLTPWPVRAARASSGEWANRPFPADPPPTDVWRNCNGGLFTLPPMSFQTCMTSFLVRCFAESPSREGE